GLNLAFLPVDRVLLPGGAHAVVRDGGDRLTRMAHRHVALPLRVTGSDRHGVVSTVPVALLSYNSPSTLSHTSRAASTNPRAKSKPLIFSRPPSPRIPSQNASTSWKLKSSSPCICAYSPQAMPLLTPLSKMPSMASQSYWGWTSLSL